jgi:hypothetical protein
MGDKVLAGSDKGGPSFFQWGLQFCRLGGVLLGGRWLALICFLFEFEYVFLELGFEDGSVGDFCGAEIYEFEVSAFI